MILAAIAIGVIVGLSVAAFRGLTRGPDVGPESSDAAKEYAAVKERQRNISGFWSGFLP
jgi:hypothetical protein